MMVKIENIFVLFIFYKKHFSKGRAGRPQFDTSGSVVIMTSSENKPKVNKISLGKTNLKENLV